MGIEEKGKRIELLINFRDLIIKGTSGYDIACFIEKHFSDDSNFLFSNCSFMHCESFCVKLKEKSLRPEHITKWMKFRYDYSTMRQIGASISSNQYLLYRGTIDDIDDEIKVLMDQIEYLKYKKKNC